MRLRADIFERDAAIATYPPVLPYVPMSVDMSDGSKYGNRDSQSRGRGYSSYVSSDIPSVDSYGAAMVSLLCVHIGFMFLKTALDS